MPDNKDIAVLAKKVYELSVLPLEALDVDGFIRRHRTEIESLVAQTMSRRWARAGERPILVGDFQGYDALTASQRHLDAQTDKEVMAQLLRRVDGSSPRKGRRSCRDEASHSNQKARHRRRPGWVIGIGGSARAALNRVDDRTVAQRGHC